MIYITALCDNLLEDSKDSDEDFRQIRRRYAGFVPVGVALVRGDSLPGELKGGKPLRKVLRGDGGFGDDGNGGELAGGDACRAQRSSLLPNLIRRNVRTGDRAEIAAAHFACSFAAG